MKNYQLSMLLGAAGSTTSVLMKTSPMKAMKALATAALGLCVLLFAAHDAPTHVYSRQGYHGPALPRPDLIVVNDFAVTADDVKLDGGIGPRLKNAFGGGSTTFQQEESSRKVPAMISQTLIRELAKLGLPVAHGDSGAIVGSTLLTIGGEIPSIDEGNRTPPQR